MSRSCRQRAEPARSVLRTDILANGGTLCRRDEDEFYRRLGLPFIPPELREGRDEIEAAERGALPHLVCRRRTSAAISTCTARGATAATRSRTWCSPSRAARLRVRRDHRPLRARVVVAQACRRGRPATSATEIELLRQRYRGIEILHGIEVDIMHDGSLDFDDDAARRLRHRARVAARSRRARRRAADRALPARDPASARQRHHASGEPVAGALHRLRPRLRPPLRRRRRRPAPRWRSTARRGTSTWTARSPGAPSPPASRSSSTATATAPKRSAGRCGSASARRGAAGSSRGTC